MLCRYSRTGCRNPQIAEFPCDTGCNSGPDLRRISNDTPHPCRMELFSINEPSDFRAAVERWLRGLPYFEPDHAVWQQIARTCASRFADYLFRSEKRGA